MNPYLKNTFSNIRLIGLALILSLSSISIFAEPQNINDILGNSDSSYGSASNTNSIADVIAAYGEGLGVVVMVTQDGRRIPTGTAWAVKPGIFATNAHISVPSNNWLARGGVVQIQLHNSARKIFNVTESITHPAYNNSTFSFDVGLLKVKETDHKIWDLANETELKNLRAGEEVAYLGFPMEKLINGNINLLKPQASTQVGNVVALSDFSLVDSGFDNNYVIRHSIPATGGASGSPIFTKKGKVVGILNAGNTYMNIEVTSDGEISSSRITNASLINFGVRADVINDML